MDATKEKVSHLFIVKTENGLIQGTFFKTLNGRILNAFYGIPFARPPVGNLRFEPPLEFNSSRSGIIYANETKEPCLQFNHYLLAKNNYPIIGNEDCLHLNVYSPNISENGNNLMEVIVFIHGGAFMFGTKDNFNPKYLLDKNNFVLVTISYRVGPLGFLSTGDNIVPGNNGLKDQVMALKWIQKNIKMFGGDPSEVTISGLSAGGASVHYHYFSEMSRNLFKRGISISGTAFCPWAQMDNPKEKTLKLASSLNCTANNTQILIDCLRDRPGHLILSKIKSLFMGWLYYPISPFGPTIEADNPERFLGDHPYNLMKDRKIHDLPWLVGFTTEEGLYPASEFIFNNNLMNELDQTWLDKAPYLLNYNLISDNKNKTEISKKIRTFYLNDTSISTSSGVNKLIEMISDRLFVNSIDKATKMQSKITNSPVYLYNFGYRGKHSLSVLFSDIETNVGVSHGDDVAYVLNSYFSCTENTNDSNMVNTMVNVWQMHLWPFKRLLLLKAL
ncbi:venom carboxylesterase-6-like [Lycorma delicatula]|uniref:venom carboxylesterase-6-like n=1 Tax=Lycorma delicatula TaxID=130591 RepID=UPI003F512967